MILLNIYFPFITSRFSVGNFVSVSTFIDCRASLAWLDPRERPAPRAREGCRDPAVSRDLQETRAREDREVSLDLQDLRDPSESRDLLEAEECPDLTDRGDRREAPETEAGWEDPDRRETREILESRATLACKV